MKVLVMDVEGEGTGVDIAIRAQNAEHEVRYWLPITRGGNSRPYGDGILNKPKSWQTSMDWADLIILTGNNKYADELAEYFGKGYPIFGSNAKASALELDRGLGQQVLKEHGVPTIPYQVVDSVAEGIRQVLKTGKGYALKPWGGDSNSAMTHVAKDANEAIFTLKRWQREGLFKGQLMMQELVEGVEMGISGFFGPGGWLGAIEESFEHKKFLTGDLGENTGEMGTVIRHVGASKLFDLVLLPLTDYLHSCRFVGDCNVNCIITDAGKVRPLEFTMRLGWPDYCIRQSVFQGDPVEWMVDLMCGRDTLKVKLDRVALGVVMTHGDFPKCKDGIGCWSGYPIEGISGDNIDSLCFQQVCMEDTSRVRAGKIVETEMYHTAGVYPLVVTGTGTTVEGARKRAMEVVEEISWPSNVMYRVDIGERLKKDLPRLHKHGFAKGLNYGTG
jgi:phosphoribosylamine---glycine ligase